MKKINKILLFYIVGFVALFVSCSKDNGNGIKELLTDTTHITQKSKSISTIESKYVYQCPRCGFIYDKKFNGYCFCQIYLCTSDLPSVSYTCRNLECKKSHDLSFVGPCECGEYLLGGFRTRKLCRECGNEGYCLCCGGCNSNPCICCRECKEPKCVCDKECLVCGDYNCNVSHNDDGGGNENEGNPDEEMSPPVTDPMTNVTIALKVSGYESFYTYKFETFILSDPANAERWVINGVEYYIKHDSPNSEWLLIKQQSDPGLDNRYNYIHTFINPEYGIYDVKAVLHFKYAAPFESERRSIRFK